ncbi:MAG: S8 family serine peptidase [Xanthomonadales bacterium]|nr:S8 family serine peptidase [Xanthomonadales bacterium]
MAALAMSMSGPLLAGNDESRTISFGAHRFDPLLESTVYRQGTETQEGYALRLVQFDRSPDQRALDQLKSAGAKVLQYYPHNAYLVWSNASVAARASAIEGLRWQGEFSPDWKSAPELKGREGRIDNVAALVVNDGKLDELLVRIAAMGGAIRSHSPAQPDRALHTIVLGLHADKLSALNDLPQVLWVEYSSPKPILDDELSSQIVAGNYNASNQVIGPGYLNFLQSLALSGAGVTFAVTDSGIDYDNPEFAGRIVGGFDYAGCASAAGRPGDDKSTGGHGTHVAGIMAGAGVVAGGVDANGYHYGVGVAPASRLVALNPICGGSGASWPPAGGWQELSKRALLLGAIGSNNSWNSGEGTGIGYNASARTHDFMVRDGDFDTAGVNEPFVLVFSAGNSGSGARTITAPKEAKNMITTGNSLNQRAGAITGMATSSSRGPAVDGRILPTIAAPGSQIAATRRVAGATQCGTAIGAGVLQNYAFCTGTSMASPHAAGLTILLTEWWRGLNSGVTPSPAMLKALLINGAVDIGGPSAPVPNNAQGWGRVHLPGSIGLGLQSNYYDQSHLLDNAGEVFERSFRIPNSAKPVRISLAWTDAPGAAGANPALVNNLDLEVVAGGVTYRGNVFSNGSSAAGGSADDRAVTENVFLPAGTSNIVVRVRASALPGDGVPNRGDATDQDFALVCSNCAEEASFTMAGSTMGESFCAGETITSTLGLGPILSFNSPVTMSATGLPSPGTVSFNPNVVSTLPGTTTVAINTAGVPAGTHTLQLVGTSGDIVRSLGRSLFVANAPAGAATLASPANNAVGIALNAAFNWEAGSQSFEYTVQIARDEGFTDIVSEATTRGLAFTPPQALPSNARLYWRVISRNACAAVPTALFSNGFENTPPAIRAIGATGTVSAIGSFTTAALPGDCPIGTTVQALYSEDMETGAGPLPSGWTSSAGTGTNTWTINTFAPQAGLRGLQGVAPTTVADQRIETPAIAVPASGGPSSLVFWQRHDLEPRSGGGCWDGGFLEVSANGGAFTAVTSGIANPPYDGALAGSNPATPQAAWCGTRDYVRTAVDLAPYAGQSLRFRFRLTSDDSANRPNGWMIDNVRVQQCSTAP